MGDTSTDQIRIRIVVRPIELDMAELPEGTVAAVTCQGNPPTPYSVDLDEPLGDREVIDASAVPGRPLTADGHPGS